MDIGLNVRQNANHAAAQNSGRTEKASPAAEKSREAEQVLADLKANRVGGVSEVGKAERSELPRENAPRAAERPTRDRYVPEQPEERASFGHYQQVSDGEGGIKIRFDAPTDGQKSDEPVEVKTEAEEAEPNVVIAESDEVKAKPDEETSAQSAAKERTEGVESEQKGPEKAQTGAANVSALENKRKALEKQLKSVSDPEERKELRKKLEQIKRQLKAAQN